MTCPCCGGRLTHCWRYCPVKLIAALIFVMFAATASAQVYRIETISYRAGKKILGTGTAVCIGQAVDTGLFLTAKHNLRAVESFLVRGDNGPAEGYRVALHPSEDVAAFCARGQYRTMAMTADEIPAGAPVQVCGFGPAAHGVPDQFCFAASMHGHVLTGKSHVIPGDSGGAAYVGLGEQNVLVGIVSAYISTPERGYSDSREDGKSSESIIVPVSKITQWLPTQYSNCPQCIPLIQPRALPDRGRIQYRGTPPIVSVPQTGQPGPRGEPGPRGLQGPPGRDAEVDYDGIIAELQSRMPDHSDQIQLLANRIQKLEAAKGKITVIVTDNGKEVFNRSGVPDGSTVRVPITRVER